MLSALASKPGGSESRGRGGGHKVTLSPFPPRDSRKLFGEPGKM